ncbi:hypothetical protein KMW28_06105 [Flammeovirga yaeyamensis]|uniref:Uncharacterized protein n=1 Tax=Flammeovirga yaeyamensis TaxID=367791 RepID=A0AAX1N6N8_9BACT|nr:MULTISPECIES: hypothetical protein [Flammeovirga]MBB3697744.1 hypothetical protein [Flammeovirga yaeyamensis]QWG03150.1 hypothetical protein KMW28_06105 [Flammeovirga yaeyamensis]
MSTEDKKGFFSRFVNNIEDYINNLVTLEVKTIVGDFKVEGEKDEVIKEDNSEFKVMSSEIHLLKGDITSKVSESLIQDKYAWVRDFHAQKEAHGHQIINDNIRAIYSLFELYQKTKGVNVPVSAPENYSSQPQLTQHSAAAYTAQEASFNPVEAVPPPPTFEAAAEVHPEIPDVPADQAIDFEAPADDFNQIADEGDDTPKQ